MGDFDFSIIAANWRFLAEGLRYTVQVTLTAMVGGILLGTLLALMRLASLWPLRWLAAAYINFFRSVPLVQVILAVYLILPLLMLYLVAEAGGPSQTGAMASQGLNNPAKELGMVGNAGTSRAQLRQWWK